MVGGVYLWPVYLADAQKGEEKQLCILAQKLGYLTGKHCKTDNWTQTFGLYSTSGRGIQFQGSSAKRNLSVMVIRQPTDLPF